MEMSRGIGNTDNGCGGGSARMRIESWIVEMVLRNGIIADLIV